MKNNYTITSDINLDVYPETLFLCEDNQSITIGDLHGNTLKLIYFLIQQGILILKNREQDYEQLVKLYKEFPDFTDSKDLCFLKKMDIKNIILDLEKLQQNKEQYLSLFSVNKCEVNTELSTNIQTIEDELKTLEEKRQVLQKEIEILTEQRKKRAKEILLKFEEILNNSSFIQPTKTSNRLIRFIGDMVGDRGKSDYFTLLMLNKLCENGVNYEIIMGNHELYFYSMLHEIHVYDDANDYVIPYPTQQITSTVSGLISLLNENIINKETVKQLVECCFISKLKLLY